MGWGCLSSSGARLVAQRRAAEFTLMRARGAALHQLGWLVLRASLVIAAVAATAAVVLAIRLTPGDSDPVGWWLSACTVAATVAGPVLISVVPQRVAAPAASRTAASRPGGRKPGARRIVIEAALVIAAIGGLVVLRNQGLTSGNCSLYPSAAPVLVAIPVAVIVLRGYPPLARGLARIAGLSRGVVAFVGLTRATRTPAGTALPAFALVLVLAMVAFPAMTNASVTRGEVAASWRQVGADAIIQASSSEAITPALQRQVASVPGVVATAAAVVEDGSLPNGFGLPVIFVDPARYAAVVDQAPGPRFPLAALSGTARAGQAAAVPVVATAAAPSIGTAATSLSVGNSTITIRLAGRTAGVPGVTADAVAARRAARRSGTRPPTSRAPPRCTRANTRRWTGRAGSSSRAR